ncbi:MAG: exodeoxyribonuclease VII large subunit [Patescibacteria group bacterium]
MRNDDLPLSVAAATELLNRHLFSLAGPNLLVEGEVAEFSISQSKWVRFSLKDVDDGALLKCFMTTFQLATEVKNGDRIVVRATPKIYDRYGQFTLNVNEITVVGAGALAARREKLRRQLEAEGLFDAARKRAIPEMPETIGLITSREAAAYTDFLRILKNRWGGVEVQFVHVAVQGERAVPEIVTALSTFNALPVREQPEVLVLTRGGGSLEDLVAFDDERVVRAVFASAIPIVVGVGHERDETLAEYAADVRASTPSNAAERVVPDKAVIVRHVNMTVRRLCDRVEERLQARRYAADKAVGRLMHVMQSLRFEVERVTKVMERVGGRLCDRVQDLVSRVDQLVRYLNELNPERVLKRGYAIARRAGRVVKDASSLDTGDALQVQFANGTIETVVSK